ncbi:hypothetical protein SLNWT_0215 [Streptomyces albus]|uniref:Uncharacterized protein n=1 Tax=Streptomyces albus (strain ATCC 21838 / DSM 41398 / FERM P-419 / JCM 4703 / NBRC 107858) TaxID=1081613 RepID=A0A0B5EP53_STRA4|nr:hypothetical protein SLNWT_0215 [Streptomyces albus]AOU74905.1 hypothetical protein SLNHY_0214 [Streptomyces albus]AYN30715.1 hypothetical protein DUI70_0212 [Streptomyces albus]
MLVLVFVLVLVLARLHAHVLALVIGPDQRVLINGERRRV